MFPSWSKQKERQIAESVDELNRQQEDIPLSSSLEQNLHLLKQIFADDELIKYREFSSPVNPQYKFCAVYCNGLVDVDIINEHIIKPLMLAKELPAKTRFSEQLSAQYIQTSEISKVSSCLEIIKSVTYGDSLLLVDGVSHGIMIDTKSFVTRSAQEPEGEKILSGPRDGFSEAIMMNLSLIRRRLRTNNLKMKFMNIGRETQTQICVAYMDSIVNKNILSELYRRLEAIDIDAVLDANYISELIRDKKWSPFRTTGITERPDVAVGKLLEGRIAIFVDGTPVVLTLPYLFIENFQSNEDYYLNFYYTTFSRMLRMLGFILAATVPAIYIAISAFHHEMLPTHLMIHIAIERANVPLPASLEAFLMLLAFDILRETGIRMPSNMGQAMSIVGALVVGQAAVQARLVAAPMIIVVAITGIASLLIPRMEGPLILARYFILILSSIVGFLGVVVGMSFLLIHILSLHSFGISQLTPDRDLHLQDVKDTFIRAPWWNMLTRPSGLSGNRIRQRKNRENKS